MLQCTDSQWKAFRHTILRRTRHLTVSPISAAFNVDKSFARVVIIKACVHTLPLLPLQTAVRLTSGARRDQTPAQHSSFDDDDITDEQLALAVRGVETAASTHPEAAPQRSVPAARAVETEVSAHPEAAPQRHPESSVPAARAVEASAHPEAAPQRQQDSAEGDILQLVWESVNVDTPLDGDPPDVDLQELHDFLTMVSTASKHTSREQNPPRVPKCACV